MTIDDPVLEVTSHSPLVFRPKAPWSEVRIVSTVTNRTVLPEITQLEIFTWGMYFVHGRSTESGCMASGR